MKEAEWNEDFYYFQLSQLLFEEFIGAGEISHRFIDGQFIAMIRPQDCVTPESIASATAIQKEMREEYLEVGDQSLRDAWAELMEVLAVCESADLKTVAVRFFTEK